MNQESGANDARGLSIDSPSAEKAGTHSAVPAPVMGTLTRHHAFVVDSASLTAIWNALMRHTGSVIAEAECFDRIQRKFVTLQDLLSFENPPKREIRELTLISTNADRSATVAVKFGGSDPIRCAAEGGERLVRDAREDMEDLFDGTKAWYSPIARTSPHFIFWGFIAVILIVTDYFGHSHTQLIDTIPGVNVTAQTIVFIALWSGTIALSTYAVGMIQEALFPIAAFAIGQGHKRHMTLEKVRWTVVVGLAVSVLASMLWRFVESGG